MDVVLKNMSTSGDPYVAIFDPEKGMNLKSFKKGPIEAIDLHTQALFDSRSAGLGALIGPHFYHRKDDDIIPVKEALFPHLKQVYASGQKEPFSHGIARYVPWHYEASSTQIHAYLSGDMFYKGIPLKKLQGFNFEMKLHATLLPDGLLIDYTISSKQPSVIGFHYYYHCLSGSFIAAKVKKSYLYKNAYHELPISWFDARHQRLHFPLNQEVDFGFSPLHDEEITSYLVKLSTPNHLLHVAFDVSDETECSWQLYHPKNESFACIEPLSAHNPNIPTLTFSKLQMKINLFKI